MTYLTKLWYWLRGQYYILASPEHRIKTYYTCGTNFQHDQQLKAYSSVELLKKDRDCYGECGIVKLKLVNLKWVEEQYIPWSCDACGAPCKKSLGPEGYCDTCRPIMLNGCNTPERVQEQTKWLEKVITWREEDVLDDEDEQLYDRLIKEITAECHSETLDWDEDRMRARLRKVLETRG